MVRLPSHPASSAAVEQPRKSDYQRHNQHPDVSRGAITRSTSPVGAPAVPRREQASLLRIFVRNLLRKLGDIADSPAYVFNQRGVGYRMARPAGR